MRTQLLFRFAVDFCQKMSKKAAKIDVLEFVEATIEALAEKT